MLQDSEDEPRVLGGEDTKEPGTGQNGAEKAGGDGVALDNGLGVRTEAGGEGEDAAVALLHAGGHLPSGPQHPTL